MLNRFSALIPATAIACAAHAQDDDLQKLRDELLNLDSETPITLDVPDIGMFGPIYATKRGVLLLSVNYQHQARYTTQRDGNISAVALFGDPYRSLAFQVNTVINDLDPLGSRGAVGFRVSKNIKGYTVSAGIQNAYIWGYTDSFRSLSLSVSKSFPTGREPGTAGSSVFVNLGVGTGKYRSQADLDRRARTVGVFGGIGTNLNRTTYPFLRYNGQDFSVGCTFGIPSAKAYITPAISDITNRAGVPRFTLSLGVAFPF